MLFRSVELVNEYAKEVTWGERFKILEDQLYIMAKQNHKLWRLKGKVDWVITDSPIPLGIIYTNLADYGPSFPNLVMEVFNQYENFNFLLNRNFVYNPVGRNQKDEGEAKIFDQKVTNLLDAWQVPFKIITAGETAVDTIMKDVVHKSINKQLMLDL